MCATQRKELNGVKIKLNWTLKDWEKVLWSDETSIEVKGTGSRRVMVWRRPGERFNGDCIAPSYKSGRVSVMIWGCFIGRELGPLVIFPEGRIDSKRYCDLLHEHLLPFLETLPKDTVLAEDNAPIHSSKYTKRWLEENDVNVILLPHSRQT